MHILRSEFTALDEGSLRALVARGIPEGHHMEYKSALSTAGGPAVPGSSSLTTKSKFEFLKDVSSLANANGGLILLGVNQPAVGLSTVDQIVGVADGETLATALENVSAALLEPRVLGLLIRPVQLSSSLSVVCIFVPPSAGKPHLFRVEGKLGLYIRHGETCQPMTAFELRESVILSMGAEARASSSLEHEQARILEGIPEELRDEPFLLIQAAPLVSPAQPLNVLTEEIRSALTFEDARGPEGSHVSLKSMARPEATLHGIIGRDRRTAPRLISEVHRNGYFGVFARVTDWEGEFPVGPELTVLFSNFGAALGRVLGALEFQSPYLVRARFFNCGAMRLWTTPHFRVQRLLGKSTLFLPDEVIASPEDMTRVAGNWWTVLHNAYGIDGPST